MGRYSDLVQQFGSAKAMPLLTKTKRKALSSELASDLSDYANFRNEEALLSGKHFENEVLIKSGNVPPRGSAFSIVDEDSKDNVDYKVSTLQGLSFEGRKNTDRLKGVKDTYANYLKDNSQSVDVFTAQVEKQYLDLQKQILAEQDPFEKELLNRQLKRRKRTIDYFNLMKNTGRLNFQIFGTGKNVNPSMIKTYLTAFENADEEVKGRSNLSKDDITFEAGQLHTRTKGGQIHDMSSRLRRGKLTNKKDTNFIYSDGGEGHVQKVVYNIPNSIMEVTFEKMGRRGNICVFFEVPSNVAYQICKAVETNATIPTSEVISRKGKKEVSGNFLEYVHLAGVLLWDFIRVRTTVSGVRYPFEYLQNAEEVTNKSSIKERTQPDEHGIMLSNPTEAVEGRFIEIPIGFKGNMPLRIPIQSGFTQEENPGDKRELYDNGVLDEILENMSTEKSLKVQVFVKKINDIYKSETVKESIKDLESSLRSIIKIGEVDPKVFENVVIDDEY